MTRVRRGSTRNKRRRGILSQTKGYRFGRSTKISQAKEALLHAGKHSYAHRRDKKGNARKEWTIRINAAVRPLGMSYSMFIDKLKKKNIDLDRKILSNLAVKNPDTFKRIVESL